jgi:serine/threonine protein kinase
MTYEEFRKRYHYEPSRLSSPENDEDFGRLGEGGFGNVFKGWDSIENHWVAIKVSPVRSEQRDLSLKREVEMANDLPRHANIARYEVCERFTTVIGVIDIAILKYYKEGNLAELLRNKTLNQDEKDDIITGILNGLMHLHHHHMAHRDLKPQNILIARTPYGKYVPLITDFGLSKIVRDEDLSSTAFLNSTIGGSIYYMAPEQLANYKMRFNVDLWAFGVILYEMMTGQKPFLGDSGAGSETERFQIIQRINKVEIPSEFNGIPDPYQTMIRQCLVRDVDERVRTAGALLRIFSPSIELPEPPLPPQPPIVLPPVAVPAYDEQRSFSEGFAAVRTGSQWGLVNSSGRLVVPVEYDSITDVQGQQALVRKQGQASRIQVNGETYQPVSPKPLPILPPPVPLPGPAPLLKDANFPHMPVVRSTALRQVYIILAVAVGLIMFGLLLRKMAIEGVFGYDSSNYYGYGSHNTTPDDDSNAETPVFSEASTTNVVQGSEFTVEVPRSMKAVTNLREGAELQYSNPEQELYMVVFSEKISEVEDVGIYNLDRYRTVTLVNNETARTRTQSDVKYTGDGVQYIVRDIDYTSDGRTLSVYCINGFYKSADRYYQIFVWTLKSKESVNDTQLLQIVRSFHLS